MGSSAVFLLECEYVVWVGFRNNKLAERSSVSRFDYPHRFTFLERELHRQVTVSKEVHDCL